MPNPITSTEQRRQLDPEPSQQKVMTTLDQNCQTMVQLSPFVCIATSDRDVERLY